MTKSQLKFVDDKAIDRVRIIESNSVQKTMNLI